MSKRTLSVSFLTAGLTAGLLATGIGPAAAQGGPVGGSGNYYFLSGAGSTGGAAQSVIQFGNPGDETYFGDWDGTGTASPMVRRGNTFFVADDQGKLQSVFSYGNPGDQVLIGDWNGDGKASIAVRRGNTFFVKNDNTTTGIADSTFSYGDPGDKVLVGDWNGDGKATLAVQRGNQFFVKNSITTGIADFTFVFGNVGDNVLVGDWANPATNTSGNGADQLAVQRGNHFFLSGDLGADGKGGQTTLRDFYYGNPGDTVFVAALPTPVLDKAGKPVIDQKVTATYSADVAATYSGGEPVWAYNGTAVLDPVTGKQLTHKAGDPKVHLSGETSVYRGGEPIVRADGTPVLYSDLGTSFGGATYKTGDPVVLHEANDIKLDADGMPMRDANGVVMTWGTQVTAKDANGVTLLHKAGDPAVRRSGSQAFHLATDQKTWAATDPVILAQAGDLILNPDGTPARDTNGGYRYQTGTVYAKNADGSTQMHKAGDPVTHRAGELQMGYVWTPPVAATTRSSLADGTTTAGSTTVTSASAAFVAGDVGKAISGTNIPTNATIVSVTNSTTVVISAAAATAGSTSVLTISSAAVAGSWNTTPQPIMNDETPNMYLTYNADGSAPTAANKATADLDANLNADPVWFKGTEGIFYKGDGTEQVANYVGGEAVIAHHKGDVQLDANGQPIVTGTGLPVVLKGDGLGVRREY